MMRDEEPLEARPTHNSWGSLLASRPEDACGDTYISGFSNALDCALPKDHEGDHEDRAGSSWSWGIS